MGNGPPSYLLKDSNCNCNTSLKPPRLSPTSPDQLNRPWFTLVTIRWWRTSSFSRAGNSQPVARSPRRLTSFTSQLLDP
nr:MAG TPA: hypothetical protein [Caudoviricetes sp.]